MALTRQENSGAAPESAGCDIVAAVRLSDRRARTALVCIRQHAFCRQLLRDDADSVDVDARHILAVQEDAAAAAYGLLAGGLYHAHGYAVKREPQADTSDACAAEPSAVDSRAEHDDSIHPARACNA